MSNTRNELKTFTDSIAKEAESLSSTLEQLEGGALTPQEAAMLMDVTARNIAGFAGDIKDLAYKLKSGIERDSKVRAL